MLVSITLKAPTRCRHYLESSTAMGSASRLRLALARATELRSDWGPVQKRPGRSVMWLGQTQEGFFALEVKASKIRCAKVEAWIQSVLVHRLALLKDRQSFDWQ